MKQLEWKKTGQPLNDLQLSRFNAHLDGVLPEDYTRFLTSINGGIPNRCLFEYSKDRSSRLSELYACGSHDMPMALGQTYEAFDEIAKGYLSIGADIGGNHLLLCVKPGAQHGRIFWKDHEEMDPGGGMFFVAQSFAGFLSLLKEEEKPQPDQVEALAMSGNTRQAEAFLGGNDNKDLRSSIGLTLAQEAARYGNLDVLSVCVKQGCSLEETIHLAALNGNENTVVFLLENGLASVTDKNSKGWTPLMCAFMHANIQAYLREKGARQ